MATGRLTTYLEENGVGYRCQLHSEAFTAQGAAQAAHIPGRRVAKSVVARIDGELVLVVIPATERLDLTQLRDEVGARSVELAHESEFMQLFPDTEVGAIPPFGNLYGVRVLLASSLAAGDTFSFSGGSHHELITIPVTQFLRLVKPTVLTAM